MTVEESLALLAEQSSKAGLYCKVSEKGAVSVYGLQRMPVTLYADQWDRLIDFAPELLRFSAENSAKLKRKN